LACMSRCKVSKNRGEEVELYYEIHGDGPKKVLFIMGFMTSCRMWTPQVKFFKKKPEYQVCIFDNRGFGLSSTPKGNYSTSNMALDALELVEYLGWDKFHVVGLSMGGMIGFELALRCLDRVQSLCLCVTHCGGYTGIVPFTGMLKLGQALFSFDDEKRVNIVQTFLYSVDFLRRPHAEGGTMHSRLSKEYRDNIRTMGYQMIKFWGTIGQVKAVLTHFISKERLAQFKTSGIPILIMTGTEDELVKPVNSHSLGKFFDTAAELIVFEGAGHIINVECEDRFNDALFKHLQKPNTQQGAEKRIDEVNVGEQ